MAEEIKQHVCTAENPWTPEKGRYCIHNDAAEVGDQEGGWPGGDIVTYRCPHCGHEWREELPQ